jgi:hypothetical protein
VAPPKSAAPERVERPAPAWAAHAKKLTQSHLRAERSFLAELQRAARAATTALLADLALSDGFAFEVAAVRRAAARMLDTIQHAAVTGRDGAEKASLDRMAEEWDTVRQKVSKAGYADPGELPWHHLRAKTTEQDKAAAETVARSFSAAWGAAVGAALRTADGDDANPGPAAKRAADSQDYRLERIAATETSRAMADARDDAEDFIEETYSEEEWFPLLLMRWDASLDRAVCRICEDMNGRVHIFGRDYKDGNEPGHVHTCCRCGEHTVMLPIPHSVDVEDLDETELLSLELENDAA